MAADRRGIPARGAVPLALVVGPVVAIVLVSVALSVVLVTRHVSQIRAGLLDRAHTITQFMARDAVVGLLSHDHVVLRHLVSLAVAQDDVTHASIHGADGGVVASSGETPPEDSAMSPAQGLEAQGLRLVTTATGWEVRLPLYASTVLPSKDGATAASASPRDHVGHVRLGLSPTTLDRERNMAVLTAVAFTMLVTLLASIGAVAFMRRHLATLLAEATLAKEHEQVAELKARIVTQTSHEFRTPLAVIISASDVLQRYGDRLTSDERTSRIEKIRTAVHQLTDLLDDVLLFGRTDASRFAPETVDLVALCAVAVEHARTGLPANLQLAAVLPGGPLMGLVDPYLLGQVLRGLLSNAVRYSPAGGTITLALRDDPRVGVVIAVADEGIGIPTDDLPRLFEPFQRAGNVGRIVGSGLGLAIAKRALDVHGGRIAVASTTGAGSTFTITLPRTCLVGGRRSAA